MTFPILPILKLAVGLWQFLPFLQKGKNSLELYSARCLIFSKTAEKGH